MQSDGRRMNEIEIIAELVNFIEGECFDASDPYKFDRQEVANNAIDLLKRHGYHRDEGGPWKLFEGNGDHDV